MAQAYFQCRTTELSAYNEEPQIELSTYSEELKIELSTSSVELQMELSTYSVKLQLFFCFSLVDVLVTSGNKKSSCGNTCERSSDH